MDAQLVIDALLMAITGVAVRRTSCCKSLRPGQPSTQARSFRAPGSPANGVTMQHGAGAETAWDNSADGSAFWSSTLKTLECAQSHGASASRDEARAEVFDLHRTRLSSCASSLDHRVGSSPLQFETEDAVSLRGCPRKRGRRTSGSCRCRCIGSTGCQAGQRWLTGHLSRTGNRACDQRAPSRSRAGRSRHMTGVVVAPAHGARLRDEQHVDVSLPA